MPSEDIHDEQSLKVRRLILRAIPMEILGTFALCYVGGLACAMGDNQNLSLHGIALAHGGILAMMVYIGGDVSGGHYNPAVSIAFFLIGKEKLVTMMMYGCAQILGGMLAGTFITWELNSGFIAPMVSGGTVLGYPNLNPKYDSWQGILAEMIATMFLCLVIFFATEDSKYRPERKGWFAFTIGGLLTAMIYGIGPITGAALNPARMLGPMIVSGTVKTQTSPYIGGTFAGAVVAAFVYKTFLAEVDEKKKKKEIVKEVEDEDSKLRAEYERQMNK